MAARRAPGVAGTLIEVTPLDEGDFSLTNGAARATLPRTSTTNERVTLGLVGPPCDEGEWKEAGTIESGFLCAVRAGVRADSLHAIMQRLAHAVIFVSWLYQDSSTK